MYIFRTPCSVIYLYSISFKRVALVLRLLCSLLAKEIKPYSGVLYVYYVPCGCG